MLPLALVSSDNRVYVGMGFPSLTKDQHHSLLLRGSSPDMPDSLKSMHKLKSRLRAQVCKRKTSYFRSTLGAMECKHWDSSPATSSPLLFLLLLPTSNFSAVISVNKALPALWNHFYALNWCRSGNKIKTAQPDQGAALNPEFWLSCLVTMLLASSY